ncbi:MAG: SurA N-terminal domain-containing protein [Armatimonadetes bacterium]|nr:SurA N-terminal domain-containing protein [Armatimonadota bacterium]
MKVKWQWIALASVALIAGCGGKGAAGGTLANVNGDAISMDDFLNYLKTKDTVRVMTNQGVQQARVAESLGYQALQELVLRKVVVQLSKKEGVYPDDAKVAAEIEFRKKLDPQFVTKATSTGLTLDRIKEQLRVELASEGLLTKGVTVSDAELDQLIQTNKLDVTPAMADLVWVFVLTDTKKKQVDTELLSGQSFTSVARRLSDARDKEETGARFGERVIARMPKPVQDAIAKVAEGGTTAWIAGDGGWAKFYVEKKSADKKEALSPEKRTYFKRELAKSKGAKAKDLDARLADFLLSSDVKVEPKDLQSVWEKAIERAKKDRKVSAPGTSPDTGTGAPAK